MAGELRPWINRYVQQNICLAKHNTYRQVIIIETNLLCKHNMPRNNGESKLLSLPKPEKKHVKALEFLMDHH